MSWRWTAFALAACLRVTPARAHAPLPRAVAVSPNGASIALALPGFGLLIRSNSDGRFSYACDALLGIPPSDQPVMLHYVGDDTLLVASEAGLRRITADGCPDEARHPLLGASPVVALAVQPTGAIAYAVASGLADGVWRSSDRGVHWERRGALPESQRVTGLVVDASDAQQLIASRAGDAETATLLVSHDAGASFVSSYAQDRALRVLAMQAEPRQLWAVARAPDSKGNRGFDVLRTRDPADAWQPVLRVNYFGGLTITDRGEAWVGDEGGGIYSSLDFGASFANRDARARVACLASATDSVWACTPDVASAPALEYWDEAAASLRAEAAFTAVTRLVRCADDVDVARVCELAWIEWQRDVLTRDLTVADAGALQPPASLQPAPHTPAAGCSIAGERGDGSWLLLVAALSIRTWRTAKTRHSPRSAPSRAATNSA